MHLNPTDPAISSDARRYTLDASTTPLGTPHSPAWDAAHIALVEAAEAQLNKRVCGARTLSGAPCALDPNHENGRCRFHGGFNLTGAQPGNRNAVVHGLYSRAIQTCGEHCPLWKSCPCAGPDVAKLDAKDRPRCPYEVAAFNAALTDVRAKLAAKPHTDPMEQHVACEVATMRVLLMRTAAALANKPMVDVTVVTAEKHHMTAAKPGAYLQAFMRVSSEHRRYVQLYGLTEVVPLPDPVVREQDRCAQSDTSLLPEDLEQLCTHEPLAQRRAAQLLNEAEHHARTGYHTRAQEAFGRAEFLSPEFSALARDPLSERFLPAFERLFPVKRTANAKRVDDS